jgi:hypothetical protein
MFRKPSKKRPAQLRRKRQEDEEDEEDEGISAKIQNTQKKLKLLSSMPLVTGEGSSISQRASTIQNTDTSSSNAEISVLAKQHQQAMKDYIEDELQKDKACTESPNTTDPTQNAPTTSEQALYQELAKDLYSKENEAQDKDQHGGVLSGLTTGLAEVILPSRYSGSGSSSSKQQRNPVNKTLNSSSAAPLSENYSSTLPTPGVRSMLRAPRKVEDPEESEEQKESIDGDRAGFAVYRGIATEQKRAPTKKQKDDQFFKKYMMKYNKQL